MQLEHNVVIHRQGYNATSDAYLRCQKVRHPYNEVKIILKTLHRVLKHKNKPW